MCTEGLVSSARLQLLREGTHANSVAAIRILSMLVSKMKAGSQVGRVE